jgi:hypothetical protein
VGSAGVPNIFSMQCWVVHTHIYHGTLRAPGNVYKLARAPTENLHNQLVKTSNMSLNRIPEPPPGPAPTIVMFSGDVLPEAIVRHIAWVNEVQCQRRNKNSPPLLHHIFSPRSYSHGQSYWKGFSCMIAVMSVI